jgi:small multidrug resistance pump
MWQTFAFLVLTVLFETFGTACIQASQQFTRLWPSLGVVLGYGVAFWFLSLTLRTLPLGVVYATWSGLGIVLVTTTGYLVFNQRVDTPVIFGMVMIVAGIAVMHLSSSPAQL